MRLSPGAKSKGNSERTAVAPGVSFVGSKSRGVGSVFVGEQQ
jgi:hypothetical protein